MTDTNIALSRRAVTGALFALPAIAAPAAAAAIEPNGISPGLAAALAAYREADAVEDHYNRTIYEPAAAALRKEVEAIPHYTTKGTFGGYATFHHLSTADRGLVSMARKILEDAADRHRDRGFFDVCEELIAADDQREAERQRLRAVYNIGPLEDESERLADIRFQAEVAVEKYPVRSIPDLVAKLEFIRETQGEEDAEVGFKDMLADLHRIAGGNA